MRSSQEARDWSLFSDWCESRDLSSLPTNAETIATFLSAFPTTIAAQGRRVRAIRRAHELAREHLDLPGHERPRALRDGDEWAPLPRALAQLTPYQHPKNFEVALRARRDGWLLVLIGLVGISREAARRTVGDDVRLLGGISVRDVDVPRAEPAGECPACAVTRWLRIATPAIYGFQTEIKEAVSPLGVHEGDHDCTTPLYDGTWRTLATLLPAIDRHGWVTSDPMSTRAISTTMRLRQTPGQTSTTSSRIVYPVATGRFADASTQDLADAYTDVDERAAALLLRLEQLVGEADDMQEQINSYKL